MKWYKKILVEQKDEAIKSAVISIIVTFAFSLWYFISHERFAWKEIDPFDAPLWYPFYSALVFIGPGAYLYYFTDFYKNLYHFFRKVFWAPNLHKDIKHILWLLMAAVVFIIVKIVVDFLNALISFVYNVAILTLYLAPPVGIALFVFVVSFILLKRVKNQKDSSLRKRGIN